MKENEKMPTVRLLLLFSLVIGTAGPLLSLLGLFSAQSIDNRLIVMTAVVCVGSIMSALLLRMFAYIGQMLFDIRNQEARLFHKELEEIRGQCEQINSDAKDINQDIHEIKSFIGYIEKHLDLNKE